MEMVIPFWLFRDEDTWYCDCGLRSYPLELDGYNAETSQSFEYQGIQHTESIHIYHMNEFSFYDQIRRDVHKELYCLQNKISLLYIPHQYTVNKPKELKAFIECEVEQLGWKHPS
jgi:hypothetical protein